MLRGSRSPWAGAFFSLAPGLSVFAICSVSSKCALGSLACLHGSRCLKTGWLYRWLRHPMYVGVLMGVWVTPRMSLGHALLALGLTGYVLIAMQYEERDLARTFGARYNRWRGATQ